jgi:hypothetical protein
LRPTIAVHAVHGGVIGLLGAQILIAPETRSTPPTESNGGQCGLGANRTANWTFVMPRSRIDIVRKQIKDCLLYAGQGVIPRIWEP